MTPQDDDHVLFMSPASRADNAGDEYKVVVVVVYFHLLDSAIKVVSISTY